MLRAHDRRRHASIRPCTSAMRRSGSCPGSTHHVGRVTLPGRRPRPRRGPDAAHLRPRGRGGGPGRRHRGRADQGRAVPARACRPSSRRIAMESRRVVEVTDVSNRHHDQLRRAVPVHHDRGTGPAGRRLPRADRGGQRRGAVRRRARRRCRRRRSPRSPPTRPRPACRSCSTRAAARCGHGVARQPAPGHPRGPGRRGAGQPGRAGGRRGGRGGDDVGLGGHAC